MAQMATSTSEKIYGIRTFLGLHESPDGDNKLKTGEATVCENFKITKDGSLKKRAGTKLLCDIAGAADVPIKGMWHGYVNGIELFLVACNGHLYSIYNDATGDFYATPSDLGTIETTNEISFIPFENKLYLMNGIKYRQLYRSSNAWVLEDISDGTHGYRPLIAITVPPAGGGELLEEVNKLNGFRRLWISPDGKSCTFQLPETSLQSVDWVKDLKTNTALTPITDYTVDLTNGRVTFSLTSSETMDGDGTTVKFYLATNTLTLTSVTVNDVVLTEGTDYTFNSTDKFITFATAPSAGTGNIVIAESIAPALSVNSYEIAYSVSVNYASSVAAMRYAELYAGTQDTRIFTYGNGTNEAFYTGIDYNGAARGDYFPDLYEVAVGDNNTPITGMLRHYSTLIAYKPDCTFAISYGVTTLADETLTPSFYTTPINRILGNEALGQMQLVLNAPRTLCAGNLYEWRNSSSYSSNLSVDERQCKRISDRISDTLGKFALSDCVTYDDNMNGEYFIIYGGNALVHNYVADAWYYYSNLNMARLIEFHGEQYVGTLDGKVLEMSDKYTNDQDFAISCQWESGAMDFGASYMRKYSAVMWLGIKPELDNEVMVTVETDRSNENAIVSVEPEMTTELPQIKRCKVKVKKFTHFKLILRSQNLYSRLTLVDAEIRVRFTSYAK